MTPSQTAAAELGVTQDAEAALAHDHRGSWIPTPGMIATRFMELRTRKGLMIALMVVFIGTPTIVLVIRLIAHAMAPHSSGPAGGYGIFTILVASLMYGFGFIVAATLGCTAGSIDLTEGMFRHLVITGRSRMALYLARIPAGLAIVVPLVAVGFTIVCAVCVFAAPTRLSYQGVAVPPGLGQSAFATWAGEHATEVICDFPIREGAHVTANCSGPGPSVKLVEPGSTTPTVPSPAQLQAAAIAIARDNYADYSKTFLSPSISLMIETGLWIELGAAIGLIVGIGLASLMGQRTVPVILMIILQIILTPMLSSAAIPHMINVQRGLVGLAMSHLEPGGLPSPFGGTGNGISGLPPESRLVAVCVIIGWLVVWTALGAWRMVKRDA